MANPIFINLTKDTWVKIATSVVAGQVWKVNSSPESYLQTYKVAGEAAPTGRALGVTAFNKSSVEEIASPSPIDVYLWADGEDGRVRVDL